MPRFLSPLRLLVRERKKSSMPKSARKWKKHQRQTRTGRNIKLGLVVLGLLLGFIIASKLVDLVGSLTRPYSADSSVGSRKHKNWDGKGRINLVISSPQVYLVSFAATEKDLLLLKIPEDLYINLPFSFGSWPVGSIYKLGQAEKTPIGAPLLEATFSLSFGIPIDGYIITSQKITKDSLVGSAGLNLLGQSRTNLSILEYLNLWWGIRNLRFDHIEQIDAASANFTKKTVLADGSFAKALDQTKVDLFIQSKFADAQIKDEGLSVAVYNATDHPGLADRAARLITNMGGRVILAANLNKHLDQSIVQGKNSYTKTRLADIFTSTDSQLEKFQLETTGADINVILGEDYFLRYNVKQ